MMLRVHLQHDVWHLLSIPEDVCSIPEHGDSWFMKNVGVIATIERDKQRPKVAPWVDCAVRTS